MKVRNIWMFCILISLSLISCAARKPVIPHDLRTEITENVSLAEVRQNPDVYQGKPVMWGGRIASVMNREPGTWIEMVQLPLNQIDRPMNVDTSEGRFIVKAAEILDPMIYREGRNLTVVGEMQGMETMKMGEMDYTYPVLMEKKKHLWPDEPDIIRIYQRYPYHPHWYYWHDRPLLRDRLFWRDRHPWYYRHRGLHPNLRFRYRR